MPDGAVAQLPVGVGQAGELQRINGIDVFLVIAHLENLAGLVGAQAKEQVRQERVGLAGGVGVKKLVAQEGAGGLVQSVGGFVLHHGASDLHLDVGQGGEPFLHQQFVRQEGLAAGAGDAPGAVGGSLDGKGLQAPAGNLDGADQARERR